MEVRDAIRNYLSGSAQTMQVATVGGNQPWICTVWFVADDDLNLYWLSYPTRRHSQEIASNPKVAAAVVIKQDMPTIGLQIEGTAELVDEAETVGLMIEKYVEKYQEGKFFYDRFLAGTNKHALYRLRPQTFGLIDDINFPNDGKVEWKPDIPGKNQ